MDQHRAGTDLNGGLGPDHIKSPEFGWDLAHTKRIEPIEGGGTLVRLNDRCFLALGLFIPLPICGIGKIPVRGDLFDHMRDQPVPPSPLSGNAKIKVP